MSYSAVIFDLFGTLIRDITGPPYVEVAKQMALTLSVSPEDFNQLWFSTNYERNIGVFSTIDENIEYICKKLEIHVTHDKIETAAKLRYDFAKQSMMIPRSEALRVLSKLRECSYKTGLISDCSAAEPMIWPSTSLAPLFDINVFSYSVRMKKPDPRIYMLTAERLGTECPECLYVGNGGSNELSGAYEVGMYPILILPEQNSESYLVPSDEIKEFAQSHGKIISSLEEVLSLL
ncbi:HAD family hydrolase [Chloroflexota bacterium]